VVFEGGRRGRPDHGQNIRVKKGYLEQLQELLHDMGGTHTLEDLRALIEDGAMQSFVVNDTWGVTAILPFPQALVLDVFLVVGELKDFEQLQNEVESFARHIGATFMRVYVRRGFEYLLERKEWKLGQGWRPGPRVYTKRLDVH
jgi:hypothetical protein